MTAAEIDHTMVGPKSEALAAATEHQARARVALSAALAGEPSHAYLFRGPRGSGKRAAARAFAAELIAAASAEPEDARRRALLDPSPHPDLVWLAPAGAQHMVEEVRERVIRAAAYRPFEGGKRVFVVEAAEAMRDESQNALLKTLEEPPEFVHLILLSSDQEGLLETVASRCRTIDFTPLPAEVLERELADGTKVPLYGGEPSRQPEEIAAAARLAAGDVERARLLLSPSGRELRAEVERCVAAALEGETATVPWKGLLDRAKAAGEDAEAAVREALEEESKAGIKRSAKDITDGAKRAGRRCRTEILALSLELCATYLRDLAAVASGAEEVAFNRDRLDRLSSQAAGLDPVRARRGAELVQETRRGLDLNVSEELALEALFFRLERLLA
ncbi:MAG: ATP-binding protein [Solirubrobacterales bacterium]